MTRGEGEASQEWKEELLKHVLKGEWKKVVNLYKKHADAENAVITKSGDTVLRMAIADKQHHVVKRLVGLTKPDSLKVGNKLGNTALHLAAYLGDVDMCRCIARVDHDLMRQRNDDDETPIFMAVLHGHKQAFLEMHTLIHTNQNNEQRKKENYWLRTSDECTILHSAITEEHFELAFEIIHMYGTKLVNRKDKKGLLPLHYLAKKPYVFKSGCPPTGIVYDLLSSCVYVPRLKFKEGSGDKSCVTPSPSYCSTSFERAKKLAWDICCHWRQTRNQGPTANLEAPPHGEVDKMDSDLSDKEKGQSWNQRLCGLFYYMIGVVSKTLWLVCTALSGVEGIFNMKEVKQKQTWSVQVLEVLLEKSKPKRSSYGGDSYTLLRKITASKPPEPELVAPPGKSDKGFMKDMLSWDGMEKMMEKMMKMITRDVEEMMKKIMSSVEEMVRMVVEKLGGDGDDASSVVKGETPLLVAARYGVTEMVEKILEKFPKSIHDVDDDGKNIVLVAVEHRQPHIYQLLQQSRFYKETIFYKRDKQGNTALHIAANLPKEPNWDIPGPALRMQWEIKWYQFVEKSMGPQFFARYNDKQETAWQRFRSTHMEVVSEAREWITKTSDSCSLVSILVATIAFTAHATVPGGIDSQTGDPVLRKHAAFQVFAVSSLVALCFSVGSVLMFLGLLTTRYREVDYARNLPTKILVEVTSLMVAIAALLVSFCAGHSLMAKDLLKYIVFPLYAGILIPVLIYAFCHLPLYFNLAYATCRRMPHRIYITKK